MNDQRATNQKEERTDSFEYREESRYLSLHRDECPECGANDLMVEDGEKICGDCGVVVCSHGMDRSPKTCRRDEEKRHGSPISSLKHDRGLTTCISWKNKDGYGRSLGYGEKKRAHKLRKWQKRLRVEGRKESNLKIALTELKRLSTSLNLTEHARQFATSTYRRCLRKDLIKGRSIEGFVSASIYVACRKERIPRNLTDIARSSKVDRSTIYQSSKKISSELGIKTSYIPPETYIDRFCSELELSQKVCRKAHNITEKGKEEGLINGKSPTGFAAASIYISSKINSENRTQNQIANVADVSPVTLRNRYYEQAEKLEI